MNRALPIDPTPNPKTLVFFFAPRRWRVGVIHCIEGIFLLGAGAFLLLESPQVPNLRLQMVLIAVGMIVGGTFLLRKAIVDLLGYLRIDEYGVHVRCSPKKKSFPWESISSWSFSKDNSPYQINKYFEFHVHGESRNPRTIDGRYLNREALDAIQNLMLHSSASPELFTHKPMRADLHSH